MKIKRSLLEKIVRETLVEHALSLLEADDETKVSDADKDKEKKPQPKAPPKSNSAPRKGAGVEEPKPGGPEDPGGAVEKSAGKGEEKPIDDDPADPKTNWGRGRA